MKIELLHIDTTVRVATRQCMELYVSYGRNSIAHPIALRFGDVWCLRLSAGAQGKLSSPTSCSQGRLVLVGVLSVFLFLLVALTLIVFLRRCMFPSCSNGWR